MEIHVEGDERNVVHVNTRLLQARDGEHAYERAVELGKEGEDEYANPEGKMVQIRFRGIREVFEISEPLADGVEVKWEQFIGISERKVRSFLRNPDEVSAIKPVEAVEHPDYRCGEVVAEAMASLVKR